MQRLYNPAMTYLVLARKWRYLELDAASNRGVEEMTQLLEQAVYAPGREPFKVYMIDEVHMLTGHAFNAMLKTLEEPPPHVKFILATTDPQKIPVTVRLPAFNLKQMPADSIVGHLRTVLSQEQVGFEIPALRLIGQAAAAPCATPCAADQAIAYSAGNLTEEAVRGMLGTIDQRHLVRLLDALATGDAKGVLAVADDWPSVACPMPARWRTWRCCSRVAIEQRVTGVTPAEEPTGRRYLAAGAGPASGRRPAVLFRRRAQPRRADCARRIRRLHHGLPALLLALNGRPARRPRWSSAARARQPNPPWPPPLSRRRPWLRLRKRQRSKRRLRQPRRLSSRLNPLRPRSRRQIAASPGRCPAIRHACRASQPRRNPQALPRGSSRAGRPSLPPRQSAPEGVPPGKSCPMPRLPPYKPSPAPPWP